MKATIILLVLISSPAYAWGEMSWYDRPEIYCSVPTQYGLSRCNYYNYEPEVPIPATVWLFLSALGYLAWRKK